jgi:hypothetical protein
MSQTFREELGDKYWPLVDKSDLGGCWPWLGSRSKLNYGMLFLDGRLMRVHRIGYEIANGPIPAGMHCCHRCDNPPCVNPAHLFLGSRKDNMADMARKGRHYKQRVTHCPKGHEYTAHNTSTTRGYRRCKQCDRDYMARVREQKASAA